MVLEIYIWGTGKYAELVYQSVRQESVQILGMIDNDKAKQFTSWKEKIMIFPPNAIVKRHFDYIIVSTKCYNEEIMEQCRGMGIDENKVILFWKDVKEYSFIDFTLKNLEELKENKERCRINLENRSYELGLHKVPIIKNSSELLQLLIQGHKSLCRFGDGEFEIMLGNSRPWFQEPNIGLKKKLENVLYSENSNVLIAVANNFGSLECYTEEASNTIRKYLVDGKRNQIMQMIGTQKVYYDAYVTRPYMMYQNKRMTPQIFKLWKQLWKDRNIVIVEGKSSRMGIGNDLLDGANSIRRILCPDKNAFAQYNDILKKIKEVVNMGDLILISLGPAATVLAYEMAVCGHQAIDIGQLDNEYEWFLHKLQRQEAIKGKMTAEVSWGRNPEQCVDKEYLKQIIVQID